MRENIELISLFIMVIWATVISLFVQKTKRKILLSFFIILLLLLLTLSLTGIFIRSFEEGFYFIIFWFGGFGTLVLLGIIMGFPGFRKEYIFKVNGDSKSNLLISMAGGVTGSSLFSAILYFGLHFPLYISIIQLTLPFFFSFVFLPALCTESKQAYCQKSKIFIMGFTIALSTFFVIVGSKGLFLK